MTNMSQTGRDHSNWVDSAITFQYPIVREIRNKRYHWTHRARSLNYS